MDALELKLWRRALRDRARPSPAVECPLEVVEPVVVVAEPEALPPRRVLKAKKRKRARKKRMTSEQSNANKRRWRAKRVAAGLCANCGDPRGEDGSARMCRPCLARRNQRQVQAAIRKQEAGHCCQCNKPRGDDGTRWHCRPCADRHNADVIARRTALYAECACVVCGVHVDKTSGTRCAECAARANAARREHAACR